MIPKEKAVEMVERFTETARHTIQRFKNHMAIAVLLYPDPTGPKTTLLPLDPILADAERLWEEGHRAGFETTKDLLALLIRQQIKKLRAFGLITITEAWATTIPKSQVTQIGGDDPSKGRVLVPNPRESKERTEILMLSWEFKLSDGKMCGMRTMEISRNGDLVTLGKPKDTEGGQAVGRLVNLIE